MHDAMIQHRRREANDAVSPRAKCVLTSCTNLTMANMYQLTTYTHEEYR